ncbi:MAG TPA: hypothetical protein PLD14_00995 [Candidatus Pacearchaeota archaeon]|nr:hypothetical protein [Candidatus Pacearchaeota archaeon]HPR79776.1 hypothetical protein [Candidatus Pacearchaeota archaeon]
MASIKEEIGVKIYDYLEKVANKEVALAMQFPIVDQYKQDRYYSRHQLISTLLAEFEYFQEKGLQYTPTDIVNILFEAKLLFAVKTEKEFDQRRGGGRFMVESPFLFMWEERDQTIEKVIEFHLQNIAISIYEKTLITEIRDFIADNNLGNSTLFFINLFKKLSLPFHSFFDESTLIEEYKKFNFDSREPTLIEARKFFNSPSFGYTMIGSDSYVYYYASTQLRAFLNLLRIAGFLHHGQVDFGGWGAELMAPTGSVLLGTNSMGVLFWDEDKKEPWEKIPDGCLYRSFGYRGLTKIFLDDRTFKGIENIFIENSIIFEKLKKPWSKTSIYDIAPSLDILSSATQMPDLGAKILQIYCCLEHLFVPKTVRKDNVKYIIGGINALKPNLIPWFDNLYKLRCDYAHKGFVQRNDETLGLVFDSIKNTLILLTAKLKQ